MVDLLNVKSSLPCVKSSYCFIGVNNCYVWSGINTFHKRDGADHEKSEKI